MINYGFHAIFTFFAIIVIKIQCNSDGSVEFSSPTRATTTVRIDDLRKFDMSYYCKFQACRKQCGVKRSSRKYYFDIKLKQCIQFDYGNCNHSYNMFDGKRACLDACRDAVHETVSENVTYNVYCRYQPDFGKCNSYHSMWYFDTTIGKCKGFAYSGCGGNQNRFATALECLDMCGALAVSSYDLK